MGVSNKRNGNNMLFIDENELNNVDDDQKTDWTNLQYFAQCHYDGIQTYLKYQYTEERQNDDRLNHHKE